MFSKGAFQLNSRGFSSTPDGVKTLLKHAPSGRAAATRARLCTAWSSCSRNKAGLHAGGQSATFKGAILCTTPEALQASVTI